MDHLDNTTNINLIDKQIAELQEQKRLLMEAEEKKQRYVVINVHKLNTVSGKVYLTISKFRDDLINYIRWSMTGRAWDGTNNIVSIQDLDMHLQNMKNMGDVEIMWAMKDLAMWNEWKNAPDIYVDIDEKKSYVKMKLGPKLVGRNLYLQHEISTLTIEMGHGIRFAIAEFHLFPESIKRLYPDYNVTYSDKAKEVLMAQLERQKILSELANAKDAPDISNPFSGIDPATGERYDLKPHQRVAVKFIEISGESGIIAYDMGTGKSSIGIALAERAGYKKVLIICPAMLKTNWKREILKFTGKKANVFSGVEPDELAIETWIGNDYQYHIINYDIIGRKMKGEDSVMKWVLVFNTVRPDFVIIDEGHYIKNMDSNRSKGVLALNGTN